MDDVVKWGEHREGRVKERCQDDGKEFLYFPKYNGR